MLTFQLLSLLSTAIFFIFFFYHLKQLPKLNGQKLNRHLGLAMGVSLLLFIADMTLYMMSESLFGYGQTSNVSGIFGLLGFGFSFFIIYKWIYPFIKKGGYRDDSSVGHHLHFQFIMFYLILFIVIMTTQSILSSIFIYSLF
ncbi:MAG: hypothetical protein C4537_02070 [Acholeplasma sp.]|jgi:hypothetical protein|nr:MAG: hypothetical protein C4537_02070 [Acholeplasma sp.]